MNARDSFKPNNMPKFKWIEDFKGSLCYSIPRSSRFCRKYQYCMQMKLYCVDIDPLKVTNVCENHFKGDEQ